MARPSTTYRCNHCTQLLPFDEATRVPDACLRRCEGQCDWDEVGPTDPAVRRRAAVDGELGDDGLPLWDAAG
jgi:hypothetical protein